MENTAAITKQLQPWCRLFAGIFFITTLSLPGVVQAATSEATAIPGSAEIDWLDSPQIPGASVPLSWSLYSGAQGTSWELLANNSSIYKSTTFAPNGGKVQAGATTLKLANGHYSLAVKLCNSAGCSTGTPFSLIMGPDTNNAPAAPRLEYIPDRDRGQKLPVTWIIDWGNTSSSWEVLIDTKSVYTSTKYIINDAQKQSGQASIDIPSNLPNGKHTVTVKLCNKDPRDQTNHCSQGVADFTLGGEVPPQTPGKPTAVVPTNSATREVPLHWSLSPADIKGSTWTVSDTFNGTTNSIYGPSSEFDSDTTRQSGTTTPPLTLKNGKHSLVVKLCNASACIDSDPVNVTVDVPPEPLPATPVMEHISVIAGKITVNWAASGHPGSYWQVWDSKRSALGTSSTFTTPGENQQAGTISLNLTNDKYTLKVKLCNSEDRCADSNPQEVDVTDAPDKKAFFMTYYQTWLEPAYDAFACVNESGEYKYVALNTGQKQACVPAGSAWRMPDAEIRDRSFLANTPDYVTHVVLAFGRLNQMHNWLKLSVDNTANLSRKNVGLDLTSSSRSVKESIRILHDRGMKVTLALGGATFSNNNPENGWVGATDADVDGAAKLITDLDLDGLDVDYEAVGAAPAEIDKYLDAISKMRKAVDKAQQMSGKEKILSLAAWSTGADCTAQTDTKRHPQCVGKVSRWGGSAGRELEVFDKGAKDMIDIIGIMSYDAGVDNYDPIVSYEQYRAIAKSDTRIALGIEPSPQQAGDLPTGMAVITVNDDHMNTCHGNTIMKDQYGHVVNKAGSVKQLANALQDHAGDGLMLWATGVVDTDRNLPNRDAGPCGNNGVTSLARAASQELGIGTDRTLDIDWKSMICYGRAPADRQACMR